MQNQLIIFIISGFSVALGFVALLMQKTYLDPETKEPTTEIELTHFGKMKTNFPALVFVFLGFFAALFAYYKTPTKQLVHWSVEGRLIDTTHKITDWGEGAFKILPIDNTSFSIDRNTGQYRIDMDIEKGKNFEDVVECIDYSHKYGDAKIFPQAEYRNNANGRPSLLRASTHLVRVYQALPTTNF